MPIEAIPPIGAQTAQTSAVANANDVSVRPESASEAHQPGITEDVATHIYDTIDNVGVELPQVKDGPATRVDRAKEALSPESESISANTPVAKPQGNEALVALSKTFDHAVFMALMNQVISGVGDTSRTLIRQQ